MVYTNLTRAGYIVVRYRASEKSSSDSPDSNESGSISNESTKISTRQLSVVYDVHLPDSGYSMGKEKRPDHRIVIMG